MNAPQESAKGIWPFVQWRAEAAARWLKRATLRRYALTWRSINHARVHLENLLHRRLMLIVVGALFVTAACSVWLIDDLQRLLSPQVAAEGVMETLKAVLLTIGGALIGAAAIAFSLVMFAMQVNVEKMPHGLFRKFSSDPQLLGAFALSFVLAMATSLSPLVVSEATVAWVALGVAWAIALLLLLLVIAYQRALRLVSPTEQLTIVTRAAQRELARWGRMGRRMRVLLTEPKQLVGSEFLQPDMPLTLFFQANPTWTASTLQSLQYAVSYARRFAEAGDHEVTETALGAVIAINIAYVRAKGSTFFAQHLLIENPLITDGFVNSTLEATRQSVRIALAHGDERAVELNLRALTALTQCYLKADYGGDQQPKTHAHIASGYLSQAIQSVAAHNMPDVMMEGVRLMGQTAQAFLAARQITEITGVTSSIVAVGATGIARDDHKPVTLLAVEEIAKVTFNLLRHTNDEVRYALEQVGEQLSALVSLYLKTPDGPFGSGHSGYLKHYYSGATEQSLLAWVHKLANALVEAPRDDEQAKGVLRNLAQWSDKLSQTEKALLLEAIQRKSSFTQDIVYWIASLAKILWACSAAPACDEYTREELEKNGQWLAIVLSFVPDEKAAVQHLEAYRYTETLFDLATEAYQRAEPATAKRMNTMLLHWAMKAGKYQTGWSTLETALLGLSFLAMAKKQEIDFLASLKAEVAKAGTALDEDLKQRTARELMRRVARPWEYRTRMWSGIDQAVAELDQDAFRELLSSVADILDPPEEPSPLDQSA